MPRLSPPRASIVAATSMVAALALGCEGKIGAAGSSGAASAVAGSSGVVTGAGGVTGSGGSGTPTPLDTVAARYFPGQTAGYGPKRMFRLTRAQLDVTAQTLLPKYTGAAGLTTAVASVPRDPLQTNYEYADNLGFNPANFAPFATWVARDRRRREGQPLRRHRLRGQRQLDRLPDRQAKKLRPARAFRGTPSDAQLTRFSDFFTSSVAAVGLPSATADLVDVMLTSPSFAFRDEVQTDASGLLLPAQHLQNITYTLADAPARGGGALVGDAERLPADPRRSSQKTIDQVLATPEARAQAAALLSRLARGQGARRVHASRRACSPSSRRTSRRPWSTRPRRSCNRQLGSAAPR